MFIKTQLSKTSKAVTSVIHSAKVITVIGTLSAMLAVTTPTPVFAKNWIENVMSQTLGQGSLHNASGAKAFKTGTRNVISGGSSTIRAKIFNEDIVSFAPPSISAGCGGLDFFAGSFSFINADQLVQLFRAVMANSIGVMFDMALRAVSPALAAIMQKFSDIVREINKLLSNSCELAKGIAVDLVSELPGQHNVSNKDGFIAKATDTGTKIAASVSGIGDSFEVFYNQITGTNGGGSTIKDSANSTPVVQKMKDQGLYGNLVWNTFVNNKKTLSSRLNTAFTTVGSPNETIMSLIGTVVVEPPSTSVRATENNGDDNNFITYDPKLSLKTILEGANGSEEFVYYKCNNDDTCDKPKRTPDASASGYINVLYKQLCDTYDITADCSPNSIVGMLANNNGGTGTGPTDFQTQVLLLLPGEVRSKLAELQIKSGSANRSDTGGSAGGEFIKDNIQALALNISYDVTKEMINVMKAQLQSAKGNASVEKVSGLLTAAENKLKDDYINLSVRFGSKKDILNSLDRYLKYYDNILMVSDSTGWDSVIGANQKQ